MDQFNFQNWGIPAGTAAALLSVGLFCRRYWRLLDVQVHIREGKVVACVVRLTRKHRQK